MDQRSAAAEFLRTRRDRITPARAGIAGGGRRRVPGLRREEVALLAGVSVDYYARMERGDLTGVSPEVLEGLAHPTAAEFFPDWDRDADNIVATLRTYAGQNPHDKVLTDLIGELVTRSDAFRVRWAAHNVRFHHTGIKRIHHPEVGELEFVYEPCPSRTIRNGYCSPWSRPSPADRPRRGSSCSAASPPAPNPQPPTSTDRWKAITDACGPVLAVHQTCCPDGSVT